ncbi:MAG TPA: PDDEXK nuclease domain-containing protein [Longimicrobium sp.]|jgi:predicted nuclease of restriction endonuclease-like (RecB) superfamily|nr:PDDEXK nuclease domain-containing protein [Longimicrobium sp.]
MAKKKPQPRKPRVRASVTPREPVSAVALPPQGYGELLEALKARIRGAQVQAKLAVNRELIQLYWDIGREVAERQQQEGWGSAAIERLSRDLRGAFPDVQGFSPRNLWRMRSLYLAYTREVEPLLPLPDVDGEFLPQAVAEIPWGHNIVLMEKLRGPAERLWYARKTVEHGWSRSVLLHQIQTRLHARSGRAVTNFGRALPEGQTDLVRELLKDPYHFEFLQLGPELQERDLERALLTNVRDFLLELGVGFALVGSQYHLVVGGQDYYVDLLFYHISLCRYVIVELKVGAFTPEDAGKMSFYLTAVDDELRGEGQRPTIGLILCKEHNRVVAEYALRGIEKPIGVAEFRLTDRLPEPLVGSLPSVQTLKLRLRKSAAPP